MPLKVKKSDIIKFVIFAVFLCSIIICGIIFYPTIKEKMTFENIRELVNQNKVTSYFLFILLQILQVVIFIIPGDVINGVGGFAFNMTIGFLLSFTGVVLGSIIAFFTARLLGYNFINKFVKKEKIDKIVSFFESNTGFVSLFIFCNLPFVPKDVLMYCAGLTPLNARKTLTVYSLSRIPGILIWTSMGANIYNQSILGIIITICALILFLSLILIIKKRVMSNKIIKVKPSKTK